MIRRSDGLDALWHPSQATGMVQRTCPCGSDLGMRPHLERPTCGDKECKDYLAAHPRWYDEEVTP